MFKIGQNFGAILEPFLQNVRFKRFVKSIISHFIADSIGRVGRGGSSASSAYSFSFIYSTVSSGTQSIHSHAPKMEVTQKILKMNIRGDSRINEGERGA